MTVTTAGRVWDTVKSRNLLTGTAHDVGRGAALMRMLVWNVGDTPMTRGHVVRKFLEHNAKIIHGVPKHQVRGRRARCGTERW